MADYDAICVREVTEVEEVGLATSRDRTRICLSLGGPRINEALSGEYEYANWISMTKECAAHLYELLELAKQSGLLEPTEGD